METIVINLYILLLKLKKKIYSKKKIVIVKRFFTNTLYLHQKFKIKLLCYNNWYFYFYCSKFQILITKPAIIL